MQSKKYRLDDLRAVAARYTHHRAATYTQCRTVGKQVLFRYRIRQQVQRSQQSRKSKKRLVYQCLGLQVQEIQCFYRGTDRRTETLYSVAVGLPEMILSRKDQREAREPERIRRNQINRRGEGQQVTGGAFNLEGACYFRYCLNVVCLYTDLKNETSKMKLEIISKNIKIN